MLVASSSSRGKSGVSNLIPRERFQTSTKKTAKEVDFETAYAKHLVLAQMLPCYSSGVKNMYKFLILPSLNLNSVCFYHVEVVKVVTFQI